ncbi:hypothetical protein [Yoonia sediminilitoris]|uniref:Uncharacterized protein n=1 Tax=Yoonia sediminilitoris TaxID=1286148 RepID=A0A2T6KMD7_9RHOB|nr:hypothetical protein [Yoonia sediminilitoris]PUB17344.1 hypothetical protein C8N45_102356 [Yoonia sediminilitoris]RCW97639.1 hypothetical protein DFP92_102356 [Yoonia sediminilitoris]
MRLMKTLRSSVALTAAVLLTGFVASDFTDLSMAAMAQEASGGPARGQGNQGGQGQGGRGAQAGQGNQGGSGAGQGGPDQTSDSQGPQAGGPSDTNTGGGRPLWAQEGIPEVELGRLSVVRSPDQVLDRAFDEALSTWDAATMEAFYSLPFDNADTTILSELSLNWDNLTIYDSPLQNLALMEDILEDGDSQLPVNNDADILMAVFLGVASDKTLPITSDTVIAVTTILGYPITGQDAADLAEDAEAVRIAVLAGHG